MRFLERVMLWMAQKKIVQALTFLWTLACILREMDQDWGECISSLSVPERKLVWTL